MQNHRFRCQYGLIEPDVFDESKLDSSPRPCDENAHFSSCPAEDCVRLLSRVPQHTQEIGPKSMATCFEVIKRQRRKPSEAKVEPRDSQQSVVSGME